MYIFHFRSVLNYNWGGTDWLSIEKKKNSMNLMFVKWDSLIPGKYDSQLIQEQHMITATIIM